MKILNLYACLGGNRYKWDNCGIDIEVTAIELDPFLAELYQERFPNDAVIIADAHEYLLNHFHEYDFIWSSPPCPTHSRARFWNSSNPETNTKPVYPDMKLYQEILLLDNYFNGFYVVENVIPFYTPLIPAKKRGRHLYWSNFALPQILSTRNTKGIVSAGEGEFKKLCDFHDYDFTKYKGKQRRDKIARNLVDYEAGETIFESMIHAMNISKNEQLKLF